MKDINQLKELFSRIHEPEVSEEMIGAYLEGNLSDAEGAVVEDLIFSSDNLTDLVSMSESVDAEIVPDEMILGVEEMMIEDYAYAGGDCEVVPEVEITDNDICDGEVVIDEDSADIIDSDPINPIDDLLSPDASDISPLGDIDL